MYIVTLTYGHPADTAAFDAYYQENHLPLAGQIPNVQAFAAGKCESALGKPAAYMTANITFTDRDSALAALGSPEGQAAAADLANFATGGAEMTFTDVSIAIP